MAGKGVKNKKKFAFSSLFKKKSDENDGIQSLASQFENELSSFSQGKFEPNGENKSTVSHENLKSDQSQLLDFDEIENELRKIDEEIFVSEDELVLEAETGKEVSLESDQISEEKPLILEVAASISDVDDNDAASADLSPTSHELLAYSPDTTQLLAIIHCLYQHRRKFRAFPPI